MKTKKGFTLLELLVVIAIIGILAAVGLGSYMTSRKRAVDSRKRSDLKQIQNAFEQYFSVNGAYPANEAAADPLFSEGSVPTQPGGGIYSITYGASAYHVCVELDLDVGNCDEDRADASACPDCADYDTCPYFCVWSLQ